MTIEDLLLETLKDIREKLSTDTEYSCLRMCGLLRHLLVDNPNLVTLANANYKMDISFTIGIYDKLVSPPGNVVAYFFLLPATATKTLTCKVDKFLGIKIMAMNQYNYTVRDVIKAASHVQGGIHSYAPDPAFNQQYLKKDDWEILGHRLIIHAAKDIAHITLKALEPLENAIKGHTPAGGL